MRLAANIDDKLRVLFEKYMLEKIHQLWYIEKGGADSWYIMIDTRGDLNILENM